jgi:hypothetical protein
MSTTAYPRIDRPTYIARSDFEHLAWVAICSHLARATRYDGLLNLEESCQFLVEDPIVTAQSSKYILPTKSVLSKQPATFCPLAPCSTCSLVVFVRKPLANGE